MSKLLNIFVGFDQKEAIAYHTFVQSIIEKSSIPLSITPLAENNLDHYAEKHTDGTNRFTYSRFLVPYLMNFKGWAIFADGDITAFSTTVASDSRLKSDIHTINNALGIVGKLRGVSYKWLRDGRSDIGVIAQEVEEVIPEIVKTKTTLGLDGQEEMKTVDYGKIVGVLINAINELKEEVEELKNAKITG